VTRGLNAEVKEALPEGVRRRFAKTFNRTRRVLLRRVPNARRKARDSWTQSEPNAGLTWGMQLDGDAFVRKVIDAGRRGRPSWRSVPGTGDWPNPR
jgi:hypothetical protein